MPTKNLKKQQEKKKEETPLTGFDMSDPTTEVQSFMPEEQEKLIQEPKRKQPAFMESMSGFGFDNGNTVG